MDFRAWFLGSDRREYALTDGHRQGAGIVAHIDGIDDRDKALQFVGRKIYVQASAMPPLEPDEYYWEQLEGLEVMDLSNTRLGVVDYLIETGANDVLVIAGDGGEFLAPFVPGVVYEVDLDKGFIKLDWEADG